MIYFYADKRGELRQSKGLAILRTKRLFTDLECARNKKHNRILVVDSSAIPPNPSGIKMDAESLYDSFAGGISKSVSVSLSAIRNLSPFRPIAEVVAAGGLITRIKEDELYVLVIHRRGVWDLPKGKQDNNETIRECALREVREEVGIKNVSIEQPLDFTVHGYVDGSKYKVKTTHWFHMSTPEREFTPQASEGIKKVEWMRWSDAESEVGYTILQWLLKRTRPLVDAVTL